VTWAMPRAVIAIIIIIDRVLMQNLASRLVQPVTCFPFACCSALVDPMCASSVSPWQQWTHGCASLEADDMKRPAGAESDLRSRWKKEKAKIRGAALVHDIWTTPSKLKPPNLQRYHC